MILGKNIHLEQEDTMKLQVVCGRWDEGERHSSTLGEILAEGINEVVEDVDVYNGGHIDAIPYLKDLTKEYDAVLWMPQISNSVDRKYVDEIKKLNKACILITSKRNNGEYSFADVTNHALKKRSNLVVEITPIEDEYDRPSVFKARLFDPLGNVFQDWTFDFYVVGRQIGKRIKELSQFTRVGSTQVGDAVEVPNREEFFRLIRSRAEAFSSLIPNVSNPARFLGNASFRCQRGFPSFRHGEYIFVSRRNVDKSFVDRNGFVAVRAETIPVEYYGDYKPSVDAPSQVMLYQMYPKVNYILHGHVYLDHFPFTNRCIPCGAMEEVDEIKKINSSPSYSSFGINLLGHGFIALSDTLERLWDMTSELKSRELPEIVSE
jgi:hypothetical protein